jgi:hypothetical protein
MFKADGVLLSTAAFFEVPAVYLVACHFRLHTSWKPSSCVVCSVTFGELVWVLALSTTLNSSKVTAIQGTKMSFFGELCSSALRFLDQHLQ